MEISDLLISKPGGLTVSESLAKSLPLRIIGYADGQEKRNKDFLLEKGVAFRLKGKKDMVDLLQRLLNNFLDLKDQRAQRRKLAKPKASSDIAKKVIQLTREK